MKAVVVLTTNSSGQILFGKRSDRDAWSSVAGHVQEGEEPTRAATRCLMEQTKLAPSGLSQLETKNLGDTELYVFKATVQGEPSPGEEFTEFKWVNSSENPPEGAESWSKHAFKDAFAKSESASSKRAVVVLTINPENKLLFGKRRDNGKWASIAGHLEGDESPAHGAVRELFEEARFIPQSLVSLGDRRVGNTEVHIFKARVEGEPSNDHDPDEEFSEFQWVDITDGIPNNMELHGPEDKDENAVTKMFGLAKSELDDLIKKIAELPEGKPIGQSQPTQKVYNYSHLLSPEHQKEGYRLRVVDRQHNRKDLPHFKAEVFKFPNEKPVGRVSAYKTGKTISPHAELHKDHKGKGLGQAMYLALYRHAMNNGVSHVSGWYHSQDASHVHQALARKHGLAYQPKLVDPEATLHMEEFPMDKYRYKIE
jgi:8-oxo-dGTP pyrophosphatase MutT (NUDIX family)